MFDDFVSRVSAVTQPTVLAELALLAACIALAWLMARPFRRDADEARSIWRSSRTSDGVIFPALALVFVLMTQWALQAHMPMFLMHVAVPLLAALLVVRMSARVLRAFFPASTVVRSIEKSFSWVVWGAMVLWVTGVLPSMMREAESIAWTLGGARVSLRSLLEGIISAGAVMMLALWVSSWIEGRLLASSTVASQLSLRKMAANAVRALLLIVGVMLALSAAGIPLGALSVFGGALGVGIGFGLQKLAANYVSGFVILAERSLRIGDMVKVDGFEGRIADIATRYTVVRALDGRESIVPNELLITQRVENHSLADRKVALKTDVQVDYRTDVAALIPALEQAVSGVSRVLAEPPVAVHVKAFAADGLELAVQFWINDPENGQGSVKSDVNIAILDTLKSRCVVMATPQRHVTLLSTGANALQGSMTESHPTRPDAAGQSRVV